MRHRSFICIRQLESVCDEVRNALHHSLARSFAVDIDVAVVGITHKVVTAPLQLSIQFVQHQITEQRREHSLYAKGNLGRLSGLAVGNRLAVGQAEPECYGEW